MTFDNITMTIASILWALVVWNSSFDTAVDWVLLFSASFAAGLAAGNLINDSI